MSWRLAKFKSARIVSHRASPLGGDHPDTSYRQCVVRIESEQQLSMTPVNSSTFTNKTRAPKWTPENARQKETVGAATDAGQKVESRDNGKMQTVVEYLVMQTRVVEGKEEDWKVWGFASESTPAKIEEDEQYWKRMLDIQATA
jgi:protein MBA1